MMVNCIEFMNVSGDVLALEYAAQVALRWGFADANAHPGDNHRWARRDVDM